MSTKKEDVTEPVVTEPVAPAAEVVVDGFGRHVNPDGSFVDDGSGNVVREWYMAKVDKDGTIIEKYPPDALAPAATTEPAKLGPTLKEPAPAHVSSKLGPMTKTDH